MKQVLATVREMIKRRSDIKHPRDRYAFVATEHFKKRKVSADFLSVYIKRICQLRVDLVSILESMTLFVETPPNMEHIGEIVDDMMTFKETLEGDLALLDENNPKFLVRI